jgi:hypothetical protein
MPKFHLICAFALAGYASTGWAAAPQTAVPPNTIDCKDFTPLEHGYWYAHPDTKRFDVAGIKDMTLRNSTFGPRGIVVGKGGYDLSAILDRKCGHPTGPVI